eukprot:GHVT01100490.1.p1 GENE.GHVT01100490.1~~GHVT01100490.1.p1  ORF type:complete len:183 (+),score=16.55 GHVT01100490.1:119-667(+)
MSFCFAKGFSADNHIRMRAKSASKPSWRLSKLGLLLALPLIVQISPVAAKKGAVQFASNRSVWQTGFGNSGRVEPPKAHANMAVSSKVVAPFWNKKHRAIVGLLIGGGLLAASLGVAGAVWHAKSSQSDAKPSSQSDAKPSSQSDAKPLCGILKPPADGRLGTAAKKTNIDRRVRFAPETKH